jgi:PAS domain S-box-containing protein
MEGFCYYACRIDAGGTVLEVGSRLASSLGLDPDKLPAGLAFPDFVAQPHEAQRLGKAMRSCSPLDTGGVHETTLAPVGGGQPVLVRWIFSPCATDSGAPGFIMMGWPREEWPRMERQMVNMGSIVDLTMDAVAVVSTQGIFEYVNPAFCSTTGYKAQEVMGMSVSEMVSLPEDISVMQQALACFRRDEVWSGSLRIRRKDGSAVFIGVRIQPIVDVPGGARRYIVVARDFSLQHSLERQVEELQRLESLGTLANGIAHRFNNILAAICGQTELLIMSSKDPDVKQRAGRILDSALKGKDIVEQLGLFGRRNEPRSRPSDLVPVVRNAVRFIRAAQPRCVEIEAAIPDESPLVMANTGEIHQVMLNLLTNSLEAIGAKQGKIRVAMSMTDFTLVAGELPRRCVIIDVTDSGPGVDPAIRHRIFEPFFTTHGLANSSGMGLAITHGIVQRHGGLVQCDEAPGGGALFRIVLPVYSRREMESEEAVVQVGGKPKRRILLVDIKGFALESGARVLEDLHYDVTAVDSTARAEELLADPAQSFSLLITALHLEGSSGVELSRVSRRMHPEMPVLLCANMRETFDEEAALDAGASAIMRRPVQREQLSDVVSRLMDCNR